MRGLYTKDCMTRRYHVAMQPRGGIAEVTRLATLLHSGSRGPATWWYRKRHAASGSEGNGYGTVHEYKYLTWCHGRAQSLGIRMKDGHECMEMSEQKSAMSAWKKSAICILQQRSVMNTMKEVSHLYYNRDQWRTSWEKSAIVPQQRSVMSIIV